MLYAASPTPVRRPRIAESRLTPTVAPSCGGPPGDSLGRPAPREVGSSFEPHKKAHRSLPRRCVSPDLSTRDVLTAVHDRLEHTAKFIYPGSVVVYEFLNEAHEWHWALGTVQQSHAHTVTLEGWSCQQGCANDGVMQAMRKEENRLQQELEDHQTAILALRAELGSVRTVNEADMNAAREAIEGCRRALEEREGTLHACRQQGVPLRLAHSDAYGGADKSGSDDDATFVAVLRAALSVVEHYVPATPLPWPEVWAAVSDPLFLHRCISYDVGYDMSLQQYDEIEACFFGSGAITEEKVHRAMDSMEQRMTDAAEFLCAIANWLFTQLAAFKVYQQCASTQSHADMLQQQLTHHVNTLKAAARRLHQVQAQLRVFGGSPGNSSSSTSSAVQLTFTPAKGITTDVLRCAIICPVPSHSRRHPGPRVTAAQSVVASGESHSPSSSSKSAMMLANTASSSWHPSWSPDMVGDHNRIGSATDPAGSARSPGNPKEGVQPSPCPHLASVIPAPNEEIGVVLLGQEELDEIAARALHTRPELCQAVADLLQECANHQRDAHRAHALVSERANRRRGRSGASKSQGDGCPPASACAAAPFASPTFLSAAAFTDSSSSPTPPTSNGRAVAAAHNTPSVLSGPRSKAAASQSDEDEEYDEEADACAFQAALLGLQKKLQEVRRENERLQRMLVRETDRHKSVEAELQRQLRDARAGHEDAQSRLASATIRAEALRVECESLDRDKDNATSRIIALEGEIRALESKHCSGRSAAPTSLPATQIKGDQGSVKADNGVAQREAEPAWLCRNNERWMPQHLQPSDDTDGVSTTHHHKRFSGAGWYDVLRQHPAELHRAAAADAAAVCHVVVAAVTGVRFSADGSRVEFYVDHPSHVTKRQLDNRIRDTTFYECEYMRRHSFSPKTGEDLLAQQLAESIATIANLENRLAHLPPTTPPLRPSLTPSSRQEDILNEQEQLLRAEEAPEPPLYGERLTKSRTGAVVVTLHSVRLPGDDWGVVLQSYPEMLREAFIADVCGACNATLTDVKHVRFSIGSLLATVRVQHDANVTRKEIDRRLHDYDYPLTTKLYRSRHLPQHGADAALVTHTIQNNENTALREQLREAEAQQADMAAEIEHLREELRGAVTEGATNSDRCVALEKEAEQSSKCIEELRQQLAAAQLGREAVDAEVAELEEQLRDMERTHARNAAEQESALGDLAISQAANDATIDDLRGQLREAEAQQADMAAEVTDLRGQLRETREAQQADMAAEVTDLRGQLRRHERRRSRPTWPPR
ncbi:hypothetical_protein (plasmid) [Leishmania braziliensis MHOM/BR/75/M2904]|uniref:Hypothetical_protein n=1 Tax=Leishmania braziliensis MHOM/BR/75/M2904 TaxID=420245 RepID=A0A3P3Z6T1_LEIBR|nr:hypothetical_protein [Leishmania braziliensis MHOM/BR/75/M2904]